MTKTSAAPRSLTAVRFAETQAAILGRYVAETLAGLPQQAAEEARIRRELARMEEPRIARAVFEATLREHGHSAAVAA